jgi:hypothetical protein
MATIPRISVAWLVVIFLVGIALFFTYHIGRTIYMNSDVDAKIEAQTNASPPLRYAQEESEYAPRREAPSEGPDYEPPSGSKEPTNGYPPVVGQTEDDLRETDPVQRTAPAYRYSEPGPKDPYAGPAYQSSEFGDNMRHPEGAFEMRQPMSDGYIAASGMGSHVSSPGGHQAVGYSSETAQNAGEFMKGIFAFDGSMEGTAYSAL